MMSAITAEIDVVTGRENMVDTVDPVPVELEGSVPIVNIAIS